MADSDLPALERALGEVHGKLNARIRTELPDAVEPLVQEAKAKVLAFPTYGRKHSGLRARVAGGVRTVPLNSGVRITTSMPTPDQAIIPLGMDRPEGWVHPVFGHMDTWVRQKTGGSWFRETFTDGRDDIERQLGSAMDRVAEDVARDSHQ